MDTRIVIVGGGDSGTLAANRLRRCCDAEDVRITVIDRQDTRDRETGLMVALGLYGAHAPQPPEHLRLRDGIGFRHVEAEMADVGRAEVCLADGTTLGYDVLVVATGTHPLPSRTGAATTYRGASFVSRSPGLGDEYGVVAVDPATRRSRTQPRVYAVGSAGGGRHPAGPAVHVQTEQLARAVREHLAGGASRRQSPPDGRAGGATAGPPATGPIGPRPSPDSPCPGPEDGAVAAADDLTGGHGRAAMKAYWPGLLHKCAQGAVLLDLESPDDVREAYRELASRFGGVMTGVVVQPMAARATELVAGVVQDEVFGPLVLFGLGGTATDVLADHTARLAPLTDRDVHELITSPRCAPLLLGLHGAGPVDLDGLELLLRRLSEMACDLPQLAEADLNPVVARHDGVLAVDVRVRLTPRHPVDPYLRRLR